MNSSPLHLRSISLVLLCGLLASCGPTMGSKRIYDPGYGPFDAEGNYLEAEADMKARQKRRPGIRGGEDELDDTDSIASSTPPPRAERSPYVTPSVATQPPKPVVTAVERPTVVASAPKKPTYTPPKPVAKPVIKPVVVKPKPATVIKPKFTYHTVKRGDTLYSLSRKYGTSVTAIQKANGLSSSTIQTGSTLRIPK